MLIRNVPDILSSEITPQQVYLRRRDVLRGLAIGGASLTGIGGALAAPLPGAKSPLSIDEKPSRREDATSYNNFYEFGTGKEDPAANAGSLKTEPWSVKVGGLAGKPGTYTLEDVLKSAPMEERIYRMRCVEAWSMVIPWVGFSLSAFLKRVEPMSKAKYVQFETLVRPEEMPGQSGPFQALEWPYVEGLRLDEAMHPLTILAAGMYGETLPNQNGAPLRLVVPWKYGFKSIKSIVSMTLTETQPLTSWNKAGPREYGFYSNVNPEVDHPRWSQATERRIGDGTGLFQKRRPTLLFNGYANEVAGLYSGMDLKANF